MVLRPVFRDVVSENERSDNVTFAVRSSLAFLSSAVLSATTVIGRQYALDVTSHLVFYLFFSESFFSRHVCLPLVQSLFDYEGTEPLSSYQLLDYYSSFGTGVLASALPWLPTLLACFLPSQVTTRLLWTSYSGTEGLSAGPHGVQFVAGCYLSRTVLQCLKKMLIDASKPNSRGEAFSTIAAQEAVALGIKVLAHLYIISP